MGGRSKIIGYLRLVYSLRGAIERSIEDHQAIAAAILAGEADRSEQLMRQHVQRNADATSDLVALINTRAG